MKTKREIRIGCKYQGAPLDLIIQGIDARDYQWFDGYFESHLAHNPDFLLEFLQNLATVPEKEVFMIQKMIERLFYQAKITWINDGLKENSERDPDFLRGLILNIGVIPRKKVKEAQIAIAQIFC